VDDLIRRMPVEERMYRFRCVEAWSMVVPWLGFPLQALLKEAQPKAGAKFVKFTTFHRPQEAPRQSKTSLFAPAEPFPYTEGLTLAEAANELTLLTVGAYGKVLARQNGAPIRLIAPWKYGFKNIKSIVKIELVAVQPPTFWNILIPHEYGFESNVEPQVPHPRWSQAFEQDISTRQRKPTLYLNGYESFVGHLYKKA
jgi:sulfoxide reductase catalytic subunit YedY